MKMTARRRGTRGYFLFELIMALALLSVLAVLLGDLFMVSVGAMQKSSKRDNLLHRMDSAVGSLRRDVWAAEKISVSGVGVVTLEMPSGEKVSWWMPEIEEKDGLLSRTVSRNDQVVQSQLWTDLPEMRFSSDRTMLKLSVRSGPGRDDSLTLVSQPMLQGRKR